MGVGDLVARVRKGIQQVDEVEDSQVTTDDLERICLKDIEGFPVSNLLWLIFKTVRHLRREVDSIRKSPLEKWEKLPVQEKIDIVDFLVEDIKSDLNKDKT